MEQGQEFPRGNTRGILAAAGMNYHKYDSNLLVPAIGQGRNKQTTCLWDLFSEEHTSVLSVGIGMWLWLECLWPGFVKFGCCGTWSWHAGVPCFIFKDFACEPGVPTRDLTFYMFKEDVLWLWVLLQPFLLFVEFRAQTFAIQDSLMMTDLTLPSLSYITKSTITPDRSVVRHGAETSFGDPWMRKVLCAEWTWWKMASGRPATACQQQREWGGGVCRSHHEDQSNCWDIFLPPVWDG